MSRDPSTRFTVLYGGVGPNPDWHITKDLPRNTNWSWFAMKYWDAYRVWCHVRTMGYQEGLDWIHGNVHLYDYWWGSN